MSALWSLDPLQVSSYSAIFLASSCAQTFFLIASKCVLFTCSCVIVCYFVYFIFFLFFICILIALYRVIVTVVKNFVILSLKSALEKDTLWLFQQNPTDLETLLDVVNSNSQLPLLTDFLYSSVPNVCSCCFSKTDAFNEACMTHWNLKMLAQIAFTCSWHWVNFVIGKKKAQSFVIRLLSPWKCYCFNERGESDMWVEFIHIFNGHCRDCLTPKLSVNTVLVRIQATTLVQSDHPSKRSHWFSWCIAIIKVPLNLQIEEYILIQSNGISVAEPTLFQIMD